MLNFTDYGWIDEDGVEFHIDVKYEYIIAKRKDGKCLIYKFGGVEYLYEDGGTSGDAVPAYVWTEKVYEDFEEAKSAIK